MNTEHFNHKKSFQIEWYWGLVFAAAWFVIYFVVVYPSFYAFPRTILISEEHNHIGEFIGGRAEKFHIELSSIGVKSLGSPGHHSTTQFLLGKLYELVRNSRNDLYDVEIDYQKTNGKMNLGSKYFIHYKDIPNIVMRVAPRNRKSNSSVLINSHYDTDNFSPGAGDAGIMIAIMVEVFRVIVSDQNPLNHPVIFLLNGAEEVGLMGSHAFITNHPWAKDIKVVINLDSAGSGGREVVFQSGPNHPWMMNYYKNSVPYPFVSTIAEELFQNNYIPSDTDFRIFRDFGQVPGLDLAHTYNGYVYHTKYDRISIIPPGTYQLTGSNLLALTKSLANAYELDDMEANKDGHAVFYDLAGWFMILYTEFQGNIINIVVAISAILAITVFIVFIKNENSLNYKMMLTSFGFILVIQIISVIAAVGVNILIGISLDFIGIPLTWYTNTWLIFGIYFCPVFFFLSIGQAILLGLSFTKSKPIQLNLNIQMILHSHCILLVCILLIMMLIGIRSSFLVMISIFFYTFSMIISLFVRTYRHECYWIIPYCLCQLFPFCFYTYLSYAFLDIFIPMQGRNGTTANPELIIGLFAAIFGVMFSGFIIPFFNIFQKSKFLISTFGVLFVIFVIIAFTPVGFPYRNNIAPQRYAVRHTNRVFYDFNGNILEEDSGFAVFPFDRRKDSIKNFINLNESLNITNSCSNELICGMPIYGTGNPVNSYFLSGPAPLIFQDNLVVNLVKKYNVGGKRLKFEIDISGPNHIFGALYIIHGNELIEWSMQPPIQLISRKDQYFFSFFYGEEKQNFTVSFSFEKNNSVEEPTFVLALVAHYVHHSDWHTNDFKNFLDKFPGWIYPSAWISQYFSRPF